jgi:ABC-2 type transport system ATP-binding protein
MRMILGLDAPTQGSVMVGGRSYRDLPAPVREVGALLDAGALHGGRAIIGMSSSAAREAQEAVW